MKTIKLTCSNLAKLTGHNKFESKEKVLHSILNTNNIKKIYIPKSNIEEKLFKLDEESINKIKKEMSLSETATIQEVEIEIKKKIMYKSYNPNLKEDESKKIIDNSVNNNSLEVLSESIKKDLMMRRGNIKENNNLDKIQKKRKIKIGERNSKMYEKVLYESDDNTFNIIIRGKMDGISDNHVVETKNRTKRLFYKIPDYEKVQMESYMFLSGLNKCIHIEHYNDESNETIYEHDEEFWNECQQKIVNYINTNVKPYLVENPQ
jgi:hypothetical protein